MVPLLMNKVCQYDTSMRVVNRLAPMGSVINEWQALEFNPYNYLKGTDGWDPLGLGEQYPMDLSGDSNSKN